MSVRVGCLSTGHGLCYDSIHCPLAYPEALGYHGDGFSTGHLLIPQNCNAAHYRCVPVPRPLPLVGGGVVVLAGRKRALEAGRRYVAPVIGEVHRFGHHVHQRLVSRPPG